MTQPPGGGADQLTEQPAARLLSPAVVPDLLDDLLALDDVWLTGPYGQVAR